ncbi:MAG: heat-inducible transcription repressor HrcA [Acidobacteria bacterium]|nr:heat-inducible transcription repressor HrcA [Acidobacteriota bacterium]
MSAVALSDRTRRVLAALVREYIETGEPVASAALLPRVGLQVSSATIRNVLAQLEDMGYVWQPHTSAGRVPTDLGYRFYVDLLLESRRAARGASGVEARLRQEVGDQPLIDDLLSSTSHVLSETSRHVGFAIAPANENAVFHRIEFVPLTGSRILVVMVSRGNQVSQKTVDIGEGVGPSELGQAANYLNSEFGGRTLEEVRTGVRARLREERTLYDQLLGLALRLASQTLESMRGPATVHIEGASTLLEQVIAASGISPATLGALLRMVEEKQRLVRLLNEYIDGPGLTVVIGTEHSDPELRPFSLIASTYFDGTGTGTVGVIGPTRMKYSRAIAAVDIAAVAVARVLKDVN